MMLRVPVRRLLRGFLVLPMLIVLGFVALAYLVDWLDNNAGPRHAWGPLRVWLSQYVGDTDSAIGTLSAIAGSLFTVTSITFSILLLAVQQGAAVLNAQVVDHYLTRASNRAWLGFFVGVSVFVLVTLVQTTHTKAPVLGVIVSAFMGALSLLALVVLIRSTIDQTRPVIVIRAILDAALNARTREAAFLAASAEPDPPGRAAGETVRAGAAGRLLALDADALAALLAGTPGVTVTIAVAVGDFVPTGSPLAVVHGSATPALVEKLGAVLPLGGQRDVTTNAGASLDHLATIGWTAISTAKSDPDVGAEVLNALHELLRRWAEPAARAEPGAAIRYHDAVPGRLLDAVESAIVASGESRQHQSLARVLRALADTLPLWPAGWRARAADITDLVCRTLPDHQPTRMLAEAVDRWAAELDARDLSAAADRLRAAASQAWGREPDAAGSDLVVEPPRA